MHKQIYANEFKQPYSFVMAIILGGWCWFPKKHGLKWYLGGEPCTSNDGDPSRGLVTLSINTLVAPCGICFKKRKFSNKLEYVWHNMMNLSRCATVLCSIKATKSTRNDVHLIYSIVQKLCYSWESDRESIWEQNTHRNNHLVWLWIQND